MSVRKATVLLADDHLVVAEGLRSLLAGTFDLVGLVANGKALVQTAIRLNPDVVVADISMPGLNGLDAVRELRRKSVRGKVIFLTMHADRSLAVEAFRVGASGYVLKQSAGEELVFAIEQVLSGGIYVTPLIAKDLPDLPLEAASGALLTPRQREVLQMIAEGKSMKEAAAALSISARTAEAHKYMMMESLGLRTTAELIQFAVKIGLVP